jgi:hypothetical protein
LALVAALLLTVGLAAQTSPQTRHFGALETPNIWQAQQQFLTPPVIPDPTMATHPTTLQYVGQHFSGINHTHLKANITDFPTTWDWADIANKPSTYTPSAHTHVESDITNLTSDLAAKAPLDSPNFTTKITTPQICLNGDCKTAWPSGGSSGATLGANTFTGTQTAPAFNATSGFQVNGVALSSGHLSDASAVQTRMATFILGADNGPVLADTDDQQGIFINRLARSVTVQEVYCECDAGTPTVMVQNGSNNLLTANLTCTTSGATGTLNSSYTTITAGGRLNYQTVTAGGTAKRLTLVITYK